MDEKRFPEFNSPFILPNCPNWVDRVKSPWLLDVVNSTEVFEFHEGGYESIFHFAFLGKQENFSILCCYHFVSYSAIIPFPFLWAVPQSVGVWGKEYENSSIAWIYLFTYLFVFYESITGTIRTLWTWKLRIDERKYLVLVGFDFLLFQPFLERFLKLLCI